MEKTSHTVPGVVGLLISLSEATQPVTATVTVTYLYRYWSTVPKVRVRERAMVSRVQFMVSRIRLRVSRIMVGS